MLEGGYEFVSARRLGDGSLECSYERVVEGVRETEVVELPWRPQRSREEAVLDGLWSYLHRPLPRSAGHADA